MTPTFDTVVVLDFGSQYTQLIARRIREARVRSVVLPFSASAADVAALGPKGIVFSGGPSSVYDESAPKGDEGIFDLGVPVLGLCYGMQL
ncbi:MAG TPA: GMP synthase (glutamine-hydrolyzing), partial [Thermoanaerobaculia bacterium]|nr:GMP synthase (glutamine-hydrolyzing) [Thermoanaerobaculia bacterium]